MFGKSKLEQEQRFEVKLEQKVVGLGNLYILVDLETGVNYLVSWIGAGPTMTPLLDANGQVIVDPID